MNEPTTKPLAIGFGAADFDLVELPADVAFTTVRGTRRPGWPFAPGSPEAAELVARRQALGASPDERPTNDN